MLASRSVPLEAMVRRNRRITETDFMNLWVIEMFDWGCGKWLPCAAAFLTRADARREKKHKWEWNNPADKFRIRRYVRMM